MLLAAFASKADIGLDTLPPLNAHDSQAGVLRGLGQAKEYDEENALGRG